METLVKSDSPGGAPTTTAVRLVNVEKSFRRADGDTVQAVAGVSLDLQQGEMVVILGPSGCGKTTLLRCIAGLEQPTGGEIWSKGRLLSSAGRGVVVPPERRGFGMMFQTYAVWPHMSVFENVAYPLKVRHRPKAEIESRVNAILDLVGIRHLRSEYPAQLSGGQQQRIAFARSLVADPEVILFDEPLSNVDAKVREELRIELVTMQKRIGFAGVYVTHDQEEAMSIADRIVVMNKGTVVQVGRPEDVYNASNSRFVASFVGIVNEWVGRLGPRQPEDRMTTVETDEGELKVLTQNVPAGIREGDRVSIVVRPEVLAISSVRPEPSEANVIEGTLRAAMFRGPHKDYVVDVRGRSVRCRVGGQDVPIAEGERVFVSVRPGSLRVLAASAEDAVRSRERATGADAPQR